RRAMPRPCSPSTRWYRRSIRSRQNAAQSLLRSAASPPQAGLDDEARPVVRYRQTRSPTGPPRPDPELSLLGLTLPRLSLSPSADLFGLRRPSDQPLRTMGGRMDDASSNLSLSSVGNVRA